MSTFIQTLIVGIRLGSVYALVALGYTMVYGIIRLINFAHGDFIMVGGYTMIFTVPLALALGSGGGGRCGLCSGGHGHRADRLPAGAKKGQ